MPVVAQTSGEAILANYLRSPSEEGKAQTLEVLEQAQLVTLKYIHPDLSDPGTGPSEFVLSLDHWRYVPVSHHMPDGKLQRQLLATFGKPNAKPEDNQPAQWLTEMQAPVEHGYALEEVSIIRTPAPEVRERTYQLAQAFIDTVAKQLEARKDDFPQLRSFTADNIIPGEWDNGDWPHFPRISYRQDIESFRPFKSTSPDWCSIHIDVAAMGQGSYPNPVSGSRKFPLQGCSVIWNIQSLNSRIQGVTNKDDPFLQFVYQTIEASLAELDAYEANLKTAESASSKP